jgi:hypothetical protein
MQKEEEKTLKETSLTSCAALRMRRRYMLEMWDVGCGSDSGKRMMMTRTSSRVCVGARGEQSIYIASESNSTMPKTLTRTL